MKFGIIREGKVPPDKRVPFTPNHCKQLLEQFPEIEICVQPSPIRAFKDEEYQAHDIPMSEDLSDCDVLFGVKEVPIDMLIPNKKYFFFSHTYKEQPYNRKLLQAILDKHIQLIDYELLKDSNGSRIIGFGRWAGIVGAYNGFRAWGEMTGDFKLKAAHECEDRKELEEELKKVRLTPDFKMVMSGGGRVGKGAREIIDLLDIDKVDPEDYLSQEHAGPVFCQLSTRHYNKHRDGKAWDTQHFYAHPEEYVSDFYRFAQSSDMYIPCHYWDQDAPQILTQEQLAQGDMRIKLISDVSCDITEPIASTIRPSTIAEPFYGYNPLTGEEVSFGTPQSIGVQAADNLPCELPKDASDDFGNTLISKIVPCLLGDDPDKVIERASETDLQGELMPDFGYLQAYLNADD